MKCLALTAFATDIQTRAIRGEFSPRLPFLGAKTIVDAERAPARVAYTLFLEFLVADLMADPWWI